MLLQRFWCAQCCCSCRRRSTFDRETLSVPGYRNAVMLTSAHGQACIHKLDTQIAAFQLKLCNRSVQGCQQINTPKRDYISTVYGQRSHSSSHKEDSNMHIAHIADEAYTVGLAAALQSVLESLHCFNRPAEIWIIDLGLSQQSQRRLLEMASAFRSDHAREPHSSSSSSSQQQQQRQVQAEINLHIITPTAEQLRLHSLMPDVQHYASNATWAKLLLPDLLPAAAEDGSGLLLYLDCDVLVSPGTDLGELWESARESLCRSVCEDSIRSQLCLAAVRDFGLPCGHTQLAHLGWPDPTAAAAAAAADPDPIATTTAAAAGAQCSTAPVYFNAGVLVLHLPRYKATILPRLQDLQHSSSRGGSGADIRSNVAVGDFWSSLKYADQDFLNVMCHEAGSFTELAPKWNVQGIGSYLNHRTESQSPDKPKLFDKDQAAELQKHPAIIHFTGTPHPAPSDLLNPWVTVPTKPWAYVCNHPHKSMWCDMLDKTPWSGSSTDQAQMESAAVDELHQFTHLLEEHCRSCNATESSSSNRTFSKQQFLQSVGQQLCAAAAAESGSTGLSEPSHTSAEFSQLQHDDHDQEVHPVFQGFKDPVNPNITLADVSLNSSAGFAFTKVWFDPHAPCWEKHVLPRLLPGSKSPNTSSSSGSSATKPLRVLEIGLWEGRSSCYILMKIADHPDAKLVCVDPFDKLYTQFYANRVAWLRNVAAAGGLGPPAAELVSRATRSGLAVAAAAAGTAGGSSTSSDEVQNILVSPPAPLSADVTESLYHSAVSGSSKVQLMHESSRTALPKLLLALHNQQQQPAADQAYDTPQTAVQATAQDTVAATAAAAAAEEEFKQAEHAITSRQFDLIYIDGSHMRTDVLFDAVTSWPLLKPGGLLVFDDYEWNEYRDNTVCHPKEGIDAFLQVHAHEFEIIQRDYQVVLQRKA